LAFRRILWSEGELAAEKEDSGAVVFEAPEALGIDRSRPAACSLTTKSSFEPVPTGEGFFLPEYIHGLYLSM
jgi:hypothetical protein